MKNYNKFLRNIAEMIEKGLFVSKDLKIEIENAIKFKAEEFEIQKKLIEKLQKDLKKLNSNKKRSKKN